jgi:acyl-homoserine lactone acylase PvdQ
MPVSEAAGVWNGWLAPEDYPKVVNPASGQLYTANSRQLLNAGSESSAMAASIWAPAPIRYAKT